MAKTHRHHRLRTKIIAWSFIPTAIILSAYAWLAYASSQRVIGDLAMAQDHELVVAKAREVGQAITNLSNPPLVTIYLQIDTNHGDPIETRARKILQEPKNLERFDGGVYFVDQEGKVVVSWPDPASDFLGQDWASSPAFGPVLEYTKTHPGRGVFTNIQPIGPHGQDGMCIALAMEGLEGGFAGAGYYCYLIQPASGSAFYKMMRGLELSPQYYILDGNQRVVYSPNTSEIGTDRSNEPYVQQVWDDPKMAARIRKGSQQLVVSYAEMMNVPPESNIRWRLMREVQWAEVMQPSLGYRQQLTFLLALGLALPVLVAILGVSRITDPIRKLMHAAQQVTAGQLGHRIDVKTGDEIEALAEQFNLMSARLQESYSLLENKVADRTRELAIMNSIISVASRSLDIQEILEDALSQTVAQLGFNAGAALKFEAGEGGMLPVSDRNIKPASAEELANIYLEMSRGPSPDSQQEVRVLRAGDSANGEFQSQLSRSGLQSIVFVPLISKGRAQGLFVLGQCAPRNFTPEELSLLGSIGQQIGVAMENAHLYEQAEHVAIVAERHRLARELHDAVTQTLFSANLIADVLPRIWKRDPEEGLLNLEELRQLTRGALAEMRTMLLEMRPEFLERADIKSLLTQLADAFVGRVRVPVHLEIQGECELAHEAKIVFYRIAQESLNNIAKHSGARQVDIRLGCEPGKVVLAIRDDGLGFDPASIPAGHMGIALMRERAGSIGASLSIESQTGQGTRVELELSTKGPTNEYLKAYSGHAG